MNSQVFVQDYFELDSTTTGNYTFEASDSIILKTGFSYTSSEGNSFQGRLTSSGVYITNIEYIPRPDTDRELNKSIPVGTLPGVLDVSASGAVNYSIPIELPPGIADLTPNLSITYNSNSGTGLLGRGWNLNGISSISRVKKDIIHDQEAGSITLGQDDKFALDGNRLISVSGIYGADGTEYRTEFEDFSRITSYGTAGSGPSSFIIETKEGITLEYGNTGNSRMEANGREDVLFWFLNKVEDNYGNYMEFKYYESNNTGEFLPTEINYTGNQTEGFYPNNSIRFRYKKKSDKNTSHIAGSLMQDKVLLEKIIVEHKSELIREYEFKYSCNNESQLSELTQYGENRAHYNSTIIEWGEYEDNYSNTWAPSLTMDHIGDFNGDGYKDFIHISEDSLGVVYINSGNGTSFTPTDTIINAIFHIGDMNGDMYDDIIVENPNLLDKYFIPYLSNGTHFTAHTDTIYCATYLFKFHLADFNGDGKCEGILRYGNNYDVINFTSEPNFGFTVDTYYLEAYEDEISFSKSPEAFILDINGDQKADIMFLGKNKKAHFYELIDNQLSHIFTQIVFNREGFYFGDYNGDGKTDFAFTLPCLSGPCNYWSMYYSTGDSLDLKSFTTGNLSTDDNLIYTGDVNGDGKSDLIFVGYGEYGGSELGLYVAYSTTDSFEVKSYPAYVSSPVSHAGDFNGDGMIEIYNSNYFHSFFNNRYHCLVQSITNGLNQKLKFSYKPLTDPAIYTKGSGAEYPLADFKGPLYVLSSLETDNGIGGVREISYNYSGAKFHQQGRGLLGFTSVKSSNISDGLTTTKVFEHDTVYHIPRLEKFLISTSNDTAYMETYTNSVINNGNGRIFPYVSEVEKNYVLQDIVISENFEYDTTGNPLKIITDYNGTASDTVLNSYIAKGAWCPSKLHETTVKKYRVGEDPYVLSSIINYNDYGQPDTSINDPDALYPVTTVFEYDNPFGLITKVNRTAEGMDPRYEEFEYDTDGIFITKTSNTLGHYVETNYHGAYGNLLSSADVNGLVTSYQYDEFGKLTQTTLPDGNQIIQTISWTEAGDPENGIYSLLTERDGVPAQRIIADNLGRSIREERTGFDGTKIYTDVVYKPDGKVDKVSAPYFAQEQPDWTEYSYDTFGRETGISSASGNISISYNGRSFTTTNTSASPNQSVTKTIDPTGMLLSVTDAGGSVSYSYYSSGLPKTVTSPGGLVTSLEFDNQGNRTKISEPNAGIYTFEYNPFGEMVLQNANDSITELTYDELGRVLTLAEPEGTTTFTYDTKDNGLGRLSGISSPGGVMVDFTYDSLSRLATKTESTDSLDFTEALVYDRYGRDSLLIYPSGFSIKYIYNNNSYLSQIKRTSDNFLIWQANSMNARDQITGSTYGNSLVSQFSYNHGYVTGIQTDTLQHLQYDWDLGTGNLSWRKDALRDMTETFTYDNLNRLTGISFGDNPQSFTYQPNGNISTSTTAGSYTYSQDKPHAVTRITNLEGVADTTAQELEYTSFNKVKKIIQGAKELDIYYGAGRQRIKTEYQDTTHQLTKYFAHGNYERELGDENRELHYIFSATGVVAIMQRENSVDSLFYVHPDHLGSLVLITDENGDAYEEKSFNAFGRMRNPEDWGDIILTGNYRFDRGFTGHEHLEAFGLINMNGRMYDSHTARFLSPDLFVQDPSFTQSFNRYSYCVNNPLKFVDPGGYSENGVWDGDGPPRWMKRLLAQHRHSDGPGFWWEDFSAFKEAVAGGYAGSFKEFSNSSAYTIDPSLYGALLDACQKFRVTIETMYGQDWFVSNDPATGIPSSLMALTRAGLNSYYNAANGGGYIINMQRIAESPDATLSEFTAYGPIPFMPVSGYILEPGGPSTTKPNQDKRIPSGTYSVNPRFSKKFKNHYIISNRLVSQDRLILIHAGNSHGETSGCLMPGSSYSMVNGNYAVWSSGTTLNSLRLLLGGNTATLIIYDINATTLF